ncbi:Gfo/Idh/MocA family protein [Kineococcus sp. SYSU DK003]|uniref:Gfo/Idh/MocA family protein n=1 Tax=Kineococcus sp. SYSU DK003 TaxID=3383124 RepID=UPI003D7F033F
MPTNNEPLRIGILGAARICAEAIVGPAHAGGHRLVAVAARDRARAEAFATSNGVERVHDNYQAVIDDPDVEVVYNPLPNSLHAQWNIRAALAGKHVLTEKPSAVSALQAREVLDVVKHTGGAFLEGFHYFHHPVMQRLLSLLDIGELGQFRRLEVDMYMPAPAAGDPRWSGPLAGGALMDLGCYGLHLTRQLASRAGGDPAVLSARRGTNPRYPGVDDWFEVDLRYRGGATSSVRSRMSGAEWRFTVEVVGTAGSAHACNFVKANQDDRVLVATDAGQRIEHLGVRSSYEYQLEAFARHIRLGEVLPWGVEDSVRTLEIIEAAAAAATELSAP